ncbi:MAG: hypothetical protein WB696_31495 [Chthoniobacterales bacterium]
MKLHYFLNCTLATGTLVIFPELTTPKVSETRGAQIIRVAQLTYDAGLISVESFLIEKWRSLGFSMPIDGQTFTWDQYLAPVTNIVPVVGDLVGFSDEDSDKIAGIITYVDAPKAALLVYVPVAPGVGQYMGVQGGKILWLIRPKANVGRLKT